MKRGKQKENDAAAPMVPAGQVQGKPKSSKASLWTNKHAFFFLAMPPASNRNDTALVCAVNGFLRRLFVLSNTKRRSLPFNKQLLPLDPPMLQAALPLSLSVPSLSLSPNVVSLARDSRTSHNSVSCHNRQL